MPDTVQVDALNTALALLGQEPVSDLEDGALQGSLAATKLLRHVETARDTVLRRHGWLCALEYASLTPAVIEGYTNWRYPTTYILPPNALRVWEIGGMMANGREVEDWSPRWQVGTIETPGSGARLVVRSATASPQMNVAYVRRANWTSLDPHVVDAIAHDIAARGAYQVTGDVAKQTLLKKEAEVKVLLAISVDGTQEGGQPPLATSIPARLRGHSR